MFVRIFGNISANGSADLRSPEKEVYFRSWDLANSECKLLQSNIQKLVQILYFQSINNSILKTHCCAKSPDFEFQCSSEPSKTPSFHHISVNFVIEYIQFPPRFIANEFRQLSSLKKQFKNKNLCV